MTEGLPDPDEALDLIQIMQRVRESYGDPPEPAFAAAIIRHAAGNGLSARWVHVLDGGEDRVMIWVLEVSTGRGSLELGRERGSRSWREYLGSDPICLDLDLLPADAPRA